MTTRFIQGENLQYSHAFKQKVVGEIESGKITRNAAKELYGIKGSSTINYWIKKMGKNHLLNKVVRIELKDEPSKLKELKQHTRELEKALADAHLKLLAYETYIEVAEAELGRSLKKKPELRPSDLPTKKVNQKGRKQK
ncbi:MAG: transposase [Ignavibacteriae bacterium]|nr:transposase [Ignavibacteriota bacterium]